MKSKKHFLAAAFILTLFAAACDKGNNASRPDDLPNTVILHWNRVAFETMGGKSNLHSLLASRIYAMVHAAMHDAVNATDPRFETYAYHQKQTGADAQVAAATAAYQVLKVTFTNRTVYLDSVLNSYLATFPQSDAKTKGIEVGVAAGNALLSMNHNSNGNLDPIQQPVPAAKPGDYKAVPPMEFAFAPFWENSRLFSLERKEQFRSIPPPGLASAEYATAFNEVKEIGSAKSATRSADQTFFARYWYETSEEGWNRIATVVATDRKAGLFTTARLFALLHFAVADAYTAGWDSKLHYNFWRPYTAIREASADGNTATGEDTSWLPSEVTPPIHDYPSTHSALGNAAAVVLAHVFGDKTAFTMSSPSASPVGASRSFSSFSQAAKENADSRVMAGIHFRFSCNAGLELGDKIGSWTVENYLKPVK